MPSWNIHIAHVERLLDGRPPQELGIADVNSFLFGNFAPDIYVGYMVPGTTMRIDYLITHVARISLIPVPDTDRFWDDYIFYRRPANEAGLSLTLGTWAHLVADRYYNGRFRTFWQTHEVPAGDELRKRKQADFDLFGRSLSIRSHAISTQELLHATNAFLPYRILPDDVARTIQVADAIVDENGQGIPDGARFQLLDEAWMNDVFDACDERLATWLATWQKLEAQGKDAKAADIRAEADLPPATAS